MLAACVVLAWEAWDRRGLAKDTESTLNVTWSRSLADPECDVSRPLASILVRELAGAGGGRALLGRHAFAISIGGSLHGILDTGSQPPLDLTEYAKFLGTGHFWTLGVVDTLA